MLKQLTEEIDKIGQPAKILKAFDLFTKSHDQHVTNIWTAFALSLTSGGSAIALTQAAFSVAEGCPAGAGGSSIRFCGLPLPVFFLLVWVSEPLRCRRDYCCVQDQT